MSQFTPAGSWCSVIFGKNLTSAAPGSGKGYLIVSDIAAARDKLAAAGIEVSEVFHLGPNGPVSGPDPEHRSYFSLAAFKDPDGNSWVLQEITTRLPGRVGGGATAFDSASELASALRHAAAAGRPQAHSSRHSPLRCRRSPRRSRSSSHPSASTLSRPASLTRRCRHHCSAINWTHVGSSSARRCRSGASSARSTSPRSPSTS